MIGQMQTTRVWTHQTWHGWWSAFHQSGAAAILAVLFALTIAGPLAQIAHCQLWYPLHLVTSHTPNHTQYPQYDHTIDGHIVPVAFAAQAFMDGLDVGTSDAAGVTCTPLHEGSHQPCAVEIAAWVALLGIILAIVPLVQKLKRFTIAGPLSLRRPPLLPPPIA